MTEAPSAHGSGDAPTAHAQPFYCPYCADEDLRPAEEVGQWRCIACTRVFALRFIGLSAS